MKKLLQWLQAALFCALLAVMIWGVSDVMERKASRIKLKPFFDRAAEYDVLFVGDSHSLNGIFPMELWRDYGIAGYNLASIGNTLPVTYWSLINALDYAEPKMVVIGIKDVEKHYKLTGSSSDVHTAFDAYPLSLNKIRAIEDLMNDPYAMDDAGDLYKDLRWEYYFTLGKYHARWNELTQADIAPSYNRQKGAEMAVNVAVPNDYDIIDENQCAEEGGWGFDYLRRMIETCQSRGIDVMLMHLPYPSTEEEQMAANAVYWIAEEYGIDYVDFVSIDQVVDYDTDCYDAFSHLNPSGARKVTDYIGRYIADYYDMPDRREDPAYAHWNTDYADYVQYKIGHLKNQSDLDDLLMLLHDDSFSVQMAVRSGAACYQDEQILRLMHNIAREHVYEEDMFSKWSNSLFPLEELDTAAYAGDAYFVHVNRHTGEITEYTGEAARAQTVACFDGKQGEGMDVRILVTDEMTGKPAAALCF